MTTPAILIEEPDSEIIFSDPIRDMIFMWSWTTLSYARYYLREGERWLTGTQATDESGEEVDPNSEKAVYFSITGAFVRAFNQIEAMYAVHWSNEQRTAVVQLAFSVFAVAYRDLHPERALGTFQEVMLWASKPQRVWEDIEAIFNRCDAFFAPRTIKVE